MSLLDSIVDGLGAVTGLGSVAANLVSNSSNVKLAREQREHDLRMWNLNNEYNKPAAQVRRLRDAGLNPGLSLTISLEVTNFCFCLSFITTELSSISQTLS